MAYSQKVVDRFNAALHNPAAHGVGRFDPNDADVATGMVGAPACGDVMKLDLKLDIDGIIKDKGIGTKSLSSISVPPVFNTFLFLNLFLLLRTMAWS